MTVQVLFPDHVWAELAKTAEDRGQKIADLLVEATRAVIRGERVEPTTKQRVAFLARAGWSDGMICRELHMSRSVVSKHRRDAGIYRRPPKTGPEVA